MFKQFTGNGDWGSKLHTGGNLTKLPCKNAGSSSGLSLSSSESVSRTNTSSSEGSRLICIPFSKDGPPLVMTGASHGFSRAAAPVWGFSRGMTGNSGFLLCWPREVQSSIRVARESWGVLSSYCRAKATSSSLVFRTQ